MKKYLIGALIFFAPLYVHAASGEGACSWHEGVNCSAGADTDGSVICNDGTKDSTVNYVDVLSCTQSLDVEQLVYDQNYYDGKVVKSTRSSTFPYSETCPINSTIEHQHLKAKKLSDGTLYVPQYCLCNKGFYNYKRQTGEACEKGDPPMPILAALQLGTDRFNALTLNNGQLPKNYCARYGNSIEKDGSCACQEGFRWLYDAYTKRTSCIQRDDIPKSAPVPLPVAPQPLGEGEKSCANAYGTYATWSGSLNTSGGYVCDCKKGYTWNAAQTACIVTAPIVTNSQTPNQIITEERALTKHNKTIANKYRGRILLQSSSEGQAPRAWYVNPKDLKRYYLSSDSDIFSALQKMAKYVTPAQFKQLQKNPKTLLGYFVVVTKGGGNYFANIADKKVHEIQTLSASQALTALVGKVGMVIKEEDLRKIGVGGL